MIADGTPARERMRAYAAAISHASEALALAGHAAELAGLADRAEQLEAMLEMCATMEQSARLVYELAVVRQADGEAESEARRPPSAAELALLGLGRSRH